MFYKAIRFFLLSFVLANFVGCALINSVSLTPIPAQRAHPIRAEVSKLIILGFNFDNDFIDPLVTDLKEQCPNGVVSGILTKDETISYFLAFKKRVVATGFCSVSKSGVLKESKARRLPGSDNEGSAE